MKYENWKPTYIPSMATFWASISQIDTHLSRDQLRWVLEPQRRGHPEADFKDGKYLYYANAVKAREAIEPPEFVFEYGRRVNIMDGRHRTYALFDAGYDTILVQCMPESQEQLRQLIGS